MVNVIEDLVFESNTVRIYKDNFFEITNKISTYDYVEAVSFICKMIITNDIWNIKLPVDFMDYIKPINSLYWLSGGDEFWLDSKYDWCDYIENYEKHFINFKEDFKDCIYLNDVKNVIYSKYNLDMFYNYFLSV